MTTQEQPKPVKCPICKSAECATLKQPKGSGMLHEFLARMHCYKTMGLNHRAHIAMLQQAFIFLDTLQTLPQALQKALRDDLRDEYPVLHVASLLSKLYGHVQRQTKCSEGCEAITGYQDVIVPYAPERAVLTYAQLKLVAEDQGVALEPGATLDIVYAVVKRRT